MNISAFPPAFSIAFAQSYSLLVPGKIGIRNFGFEHFSFFNHEPHEPEPKLKFSVFPSCFTNEGYTGSNVFSHTACSFSNGIS
jgi:hypothetical protein